MFKVHYNNEKETTSLLRKLSHILSIETVKSRATEDGFQKEFEIRFLKESSGIFKWPENDQEDMVGTLDLSKLSHRVF